MRSLRRSTKHAFDTVQRVFSYAVWGKWIISFLFWELTGLLPFTPWRTLSETAWDVEKEEPGSARMLEVFLLGLVVHIRYRDTLESSLEWADELEPYFDEFVRRYT